MPSADLYLASCSPRRRELLAQIGLKIVVIPQSVSEQRLPAESPRDYVQRLALEKAQAGFLSQGGALDQPVLGADTTVVVDGDILGKPESQNSGLAMLSRLSGRSHWVLSALAVVGKDDLGHYREEVRLSQSQVFFRKISAAEQLAYWRSGEPADKAGAYGIQGLAALFIERLEGSYSGVMGLPLFETAELLALFGIRALPKQL
jgi:nucleoside triphosphate pyrophosphatase